MGWDSHFNIQQNLSDKTNEQNGEFGRSELYYSTIKGLGIRLKLIFNVNPSLQTRENAYQSRGKSKQSMQTNNF